MNNYKRLAAMSIATTMLAGNTMAVFAASEGGAEGAGSYEGYVEETSVFSVNVPTDASGTQGFDFFVDPNGLLEETEYARIDGATEADFEAGASLFFTRDNSDGTTPKYGKDSEAITLENMSSYAVNVEVSATVTGADGITLAEAAPGADAADPTLYLAIASASEAAAITSEGGKFTGTIDGEANNFEIQYDSSEGKYVYAEKDTSDGTTLDPWKTLSFNLTGACGGTWTDAQAEAAPSVALAWKITDPKASATASASSVVAGGSVDITLPSGVTITGIQKLKADGTYNELPANYYTLTDIEGGKKLTVNASIKTQYVAATSIQVILSSGDPITIAVE